MVIQATFRPRCMPGLVISNYNPVAPGTTQKRTKHPNERHGTERQGTVEGSSHQQGALRATDLAPTSSSTALMPRVQACSQNLAHCEQRTDPSPPPLPQGRPAESQLIERTLRYETHKARQEGSCRTRKPTATTWETATPHPEIVSTLPTPRCNEKDARFHARTSSTPCTAKLQRAPSGYQLDVAR